MERSLHLAPKIWPRFREDQARATKVAERFKKDLPEGRVLSVLELKAVARRVGQDEMIFELFGRNQPLRSLADYQAASRYIT